MEAPARGQGEAREGPNFDPIGNPLLRHESRKVEPGGGWTGMAATGAKVTCHHTLHRAPWSPRNSCFSNRGRCSLEPEPATVRQDSQAPGRSPLLGLYGLPASLPHESSLRFVTKQLLQNLCEVR